MTKQLTNIARRPLLWATGGFLVFGLSLAMLPRPVRGAEASTRVLARGGGTTIIEGGTGSPGFVPVITTVAFHAAAAGRSVTGSFECLARAPQAATGTGSGEFTVNAMYVTGQITDAKISGDTATLIGTATITGLGAGTAVPFTFVVRKGGPGATAVLTTNGDPHLVFNEVLLEGSFEVE
jgi:hypothetical protein